MATTRTISTLAGAAATLVLLVAALALRDELPVAAQTEHEADAEEGYAGATAVRQEPDAIEAAFPHESYQPGAVAVLRLWTPTPRASVRVYRVGPERQLTAGNNTMEGVPVTAAHRVLGATVRIRIGDWPSGLYFAKVTSPRRVGFAPFVVRPSRLGEHRVAVVLPTRTWQAYNFRDDDADGDGDTWYATRGHLQARLGRPFLNRGVPPNYRQYDLKFLRWLHQTAKAVDVLSQAELDGATGAELAHAYDLLVFPGHHEYVTRREYDAVEEFRDRGGNLVFLSANNFFWQIELRGRTMTRVAKWREVGRPEAALIGVQYIGDDEGVHRGPWLVRRHADAGWIFAGVRLRDGNEFSNAGIEIDAVASSSPRGTRVVAEIPNLFGPGMTAHMTYYETAAGARVFAAGAFTLAGSVRQPAVRRLLENLWRRLGPRQETTRQRRLASTGRGYGWPVKPFDVQHPVRGFFGDPRIGMTPKGMHRSFHFGIDISVPDGSPVYATLSGTVQRWAHRPEVVGIQGDDGHVSFEYWHIRPAVAAGDRVTAYRTVVGYVETGWGHVHFSELRDGVYLNPLRLGALGPFEDPTTPVVKSLRGERDAAGLKLERLSGSVDLVAEAFDVTPLLVPEPWADRPVSPASIRWRVRGRPWSAAVDFRQGVPADDRYGEVYALWTRQNKPWSNGRYRFYLAHGWDTTTLRDGDYQVDVAASDTRGNTTVRSFAIRIDNATT